MTETIDIAWLKERIAEYVFSLSAGGWDAAIVECKAIPEEDCWEDPPSTAAVAGTLRLLAVLRDANFPPPFSVYPHGDEVIAEWAWDYPKEDWLRVTMHVQHKTPTVGEFGFFTGNRPAEFGNLVLAE